MSFEKPTLEHHGYDESPETVYGRYLKHLDLSSQSLEGKTILDVGAGSGQFAQGAKEQGIDCTIVSIDRNTPEKNQGGTTAFVQAEAQNLPFPDNTFDLVVSVAGLPQIGAQIEIQIQGIQTGDSEKILASISQALTECLRVTKSKGQLRFGSVPKLREEQYKNFEDTILKFGTILEQKNIDGRQLFVVQKN